MVHIYRFRKGQRFADISGDFLAQGAIPALHMSRLACFFANAAMRFFRKNFLVGVPKVAKGMTVTIGLRNLIP